MLAFVPCVQSCAADSQRDVGVIQKMCAPWACEAGQRLWKVRTARCKVRWWMAREELELSGREKSAPPDADLDSG